jgi:magnesium transporter
MRSIKGKKITWIDVFKPTEEDIAALKKNHNFHPVILDELLHPSSRTHIEEYGDYLFLVYHFPEYDHESKTSRRCEIDFLITKDTIVTVHYENLDQINTLFDMLARNQKERDRILSHDSLLVTYYAFEKAISFSLRQLRHIEEQVASVAQEIFSGKEEHLLRDISYIKRNILDYRLIVHNQEKFFPELVQIGAKFWGEKSRVYLSDLVNDNMPVHRNLENYFQTIESLEVTNAQLLDAQTNKIIKRFTIGTFLGSLPLYFVFFSEFEYIHEIFASTPVRFWTTFICVHALVLALWFSFKKKKIV